MPAACRCSGLDGSQATGLAWAPGDRLHCAGLPGVSTPVALLDDRTGIAAAVVRHR